MDGTTPPSGSVVEENPHNSTAKLDRLGKQNLDLFESENFADIEIVCKDTTWKVHALILRSRCAFFERALKNNWQEVQTGQVRLDEENPEQVNELLKFIYTGRYVPDLAPDTKCISAFVLESNVALWYTADFFLLPELKTDIQEYLLGRFAATLWLFHHYKISLVNCGTISRNNVHLEEHEFFNDLTSALAKIYENPNARELQKLFAVFACGLREHLPKETMWDLMSKTPAFRQDVSTVLIALHFPNATG